MSLFTPNDLYRFWTKVKFSNGGCWEWTAATRVGGNGARYGMFNMHNWEGNRCWLAHRIAYMIKSGENIPDGLLVRHKCNNPICVNPNHLILGTHQDNAEDAMEAGHVRRGEEHHGSKLTWGAVNDMRQMWLSGKYTQLDIADKYRVGSNTVCRIVQNRWWRDRDYTPPLNSNGKRLSPNVKSEAELLFKSGHSRRQISQILNIQLTTVYYIIKQYLKKEGTASCSVEVCI